MNFLDPHFQPFLRTVEFQPADAEPIFLTLHGENGRTSTFSTSASPSDPRRLSRIVKFLLWARGAWKLEIRGPAWVAASLTAEYSPQGARACDADMMQKVYGRTFEVVHATGAPPADTAPARRSLAGKLDGCRIGFDLGASDYKIAAVHNGETVFSEEFPWDPKNAADPDYHFEKLQAGLEAAASKLPRVDAIGGSSAGIIVDNEIRVASLIRSVPSGEPLRRAQRLFHRVADHWKVPVEVANDGDVTALAGAMSLRVHGVLGIAMGSSEAAGYINHEGHITGWLNELAFAPVDDQPDAPADEWSGDRGVGALYFSQQATNRLLPVAGISMPETMGLPERLKELQRLMAEGNARATSIYETLGIYLGHTLPLYAKFYEFEHVLLLGRVTTGRGGEILLERARQVLEEHYPDTAKTFSLHVPDEKSRRVGQAVAAASLPTL